MKKLRGLGRVLAAAITAIVVSVISWGRFGGGGGGEPAVRQTSPQSVRTLVVIVQGTYGNAAFWSNAVGGKASFASELQRAMGPQCQLYPFLWASSVYHQARVAAARDLADTIDKKAVGFDRVCLVGHSHGGNVALYAAGLCRTRIDTVMCLSTPQLHLITVNDREELLQLPIYCTDATLRNVKSFINVWPSTDEVPAGWANWETGLSDAEAIAMTADLRDRYRQPRLADDGGLFRLGPAARKQAFKGLNVAGAHNLTVQSFVPDNFGSGAHGAIHSRRMGYVLGELLRDGPTPPRLTYIDSLVQPMGADDGEPVAEADYRAALAASSAYFNHVGWRLRRVTVQLSDATRAADADTDGSLPDPILELRGPNGDWAVRTQAMSNSPAATWWPRFIVFQNVPCILGLYDDDLFGREWLGGWTLDGASAPPSSIPANAAQGVHWSYEADWQVVHY